jgi:YggT family protein
MRFLSKCTDPLLNFTRRVIPLHLGGLDFSPIILIIGLNLLGNLLTGGLVLLGRGLPLSYLFPFLAINLLNMIQSIIFLLGVIMAVRVILSLVNPSYYNPLVMFVYGITEPLLAPLRPWFPTGPKGLDIKAIVFIIGLVLLYILIDRLKLTLLVPFLSN